MSNWSKKAISLICISLNINDTVTHNGISSDLEHHILWLIMGFLKISNTTWMGPCEGCDLNQICGLWEFDWNIKNRCKVMTIAQIGSGELKTETVKIYMTNLIGSAPCSSNTFISNSWPYLAAMCNDVFPFLSQASISAPRNRHLTSINVKL
jgi:hypothetical protein